MFRNTLSSCAVVCLFSCGAAGPVAGVADTHCGTEFVTVNPADCMSVAGPDGGVKEEEVVRYNAEADDDDCKYHVKFSTTPVAQSADVTITAVITRKSDGAVATGADPEVEAFLSKSHPAPETTSKTTETKPGTYTMGPVRFDASGKWTLKFHFYEACYDLAESSPHGHVSFFFDVP